MRWARLRQISPAPTDSEQLAAVINNKTRIALVLLFVAAMASFGWVAARLTGLGSGAPDHAWPQGDQAPARSFALTDHRGAPVTERDYSGKFLLVSFGYTFCPDVCPTTLFGVSQVLDLLGEDAGQVQALFVTVDPARDTTEVLAEYVANFHPAIDGLTGTAEQVGAAAKSFHVYFEKAASAEAGSGSEDGDYLMNHSALIDLVGPDGRYLASFPHVIRADQLAPVIRDYIHDKGSRGTGS
jgi:protein SCO1/2